MWARPARSHALPTATAAGAAAAAAGGVSTPLPSWRAALARRPPAVAARSAAPPIAAECKRLQPNVNGCNAARRCVRLQRTNYNRAAAPSGRLRGSHIGRCGLLRPEGIPVRRRLYMAGARRRRKGRLRVRRVSLAVLHKGDRPRRRGNAEREQQLRMRARDPSIHPQQPVDRGDSAGGRKPAVRPSAG